MPFRRPLRVAATIMASAVAGCTTVSVALTPTSVTLATGTPGGVYHPVGSAICQMFDLGGAHQAMPCVAVSSDGSVANIRRVESGDANFGLSQTDVAYAAFHGEGPCRSPIETSPASPIEMSRSSVCLRLIEVAWDDGDHDELQRTDAPAGADRCR